ESSSRIDGHNLVRVWNRYNSGVRAATTPLAGPRGGKLARRPQRPWNSGVRARADSVPLPVQRSSAASTAPNVLRPQDDGQADRARFPAASASTPTYTIWNVHDYGPNDASQVECLSGRRAD